MKYKFKIALSYATENEELVRQIYHYLKAEKIDVFFAPTQEGQITLSGENQREIFYEIFGKSAEYVALFVSKDYVRKKVPMEEANIAFTNHKDDGHVIPIYLDETKLPSDMLDPEQTNYFKSNSPIVIAKHLSSKVKNEEVQEEERNNLKEGHNIMNVNKNMAEKQVFVQKLEGTIRL